MSAVKLQKKKKVPIERVHKAFAISSIVGAMLGASNNGDPKLTALTIQINKAMKVFSVKVGRVQYYTISKEIQELWVKMAEQHNNTLDDDEVSVFIELVCNLIPKQDFKAFLNMHTYATTEKLSDYKKSALLMSVLSLDAELNEMFNTSPVATRESLGKILSKTPKVKRVKKQRDKSQKEVKEKRVSKSKIKEAERKVKSRNFLRDRIAQAKQVVGE